MKVKKFKNLWAMGLILFGVLLIAFYVAKIFFPKFIIGIAEIPSIVRFGNYIATHKWAFCIFNVTISYIGGYIYACACCRVNKLNIKQNLVLLGIVLLGLIFQLFSATIYTPYTYTTLILIPFLLLILDKKLCKETFVSTCSCFCVDIMSQAFSMAIRNIVVLSLWINPATMIILLIDTWIWRILLYLFFNYKTKKEN